MSSHYLLEKLDGEFRKTCKIILGDEIGSLEDFGPYLSEYMQKPARFKSHLSGNDVYVSGEHYSPSGKFAGFEEINWKQKFEPLNINEIKDMDSMVQALGERFVYAGNVILGESRNVEKSTNITDSFFVSDSSMMSKSEYIIYSSFGRNCKNLFGTHDTANTNFGIRVRCIGGPVGINRLFESFLISASSDIFYSGNLIGCQKCWFSFFQRGKRYLIGNLQLSPDEYARIEASLKEQLREELSSNKRAPGLFDLLKMKKEGKPQKFKSIPSPGCNPARAKTEVEKAWRSTSSVMLGRELSEIDDYGKWLSSKVDFYDIGTERSPISGENVYIVKRYYMLESLPPVFVGMEKEQLSSVALAKDELSSNFRELMKHATRLAYMSVYYSENCSNIDAPLITTNATNGYKNIMTVLTKNTGYSFWPRESESIFGSSCVFSSSFCINTNHAQDVSRSFEVDAATNSSDIYFCHNVEGLTNSMFCFNSKSRKNSIGNTEYPLETYKKVKSALLAQISDELERTKTLKWSIYNIGNVK